MKEIIQLLARTGDEIYAKIATVIAVDEEGKTADVQPLDGSAEIYDVYITVDDNKGGIYTRPAVGSLVCVVFVSKEIAVVVNPSELSKFRVKIENTTLAIDKDGFLLQKGNETLAKLTADLLKAIKAMKFTTNMGPTIQLINIQDFIALEKRFKVFLKDS